MSFLELANKRYSVRSFKEKQVEKDKVDKILEAGRVAPTAVNSQPQRIIVLDNKEMLDKVRQCTKFHFDAPLNFLICYDKNLSWKRKFDGKDYGEADTSIIVTHMMLEIADLGLGSCWVGYLDPQKTKEVFNLPDNYEVICFLPTGYASNDSEPSLSHLERKELGETVTYNEI